MQKPRYYICNMPLTVVGTVHRISWDPLSSYILFVHTNTGSPVDRHPGQSVQNTCAQWGWAMSTSIAGTLTHLWAGLNLWCFTYIRWPRYYCFLLSPAGLLSVVIRVIMIIFSSSCLSNQRHRGDRLHDTKIYQEGKPTRYNRPGFIEPWRFVFPCPRAAFWILVIPARKRVLYALRPNGTGAWRGFANFFRARCLFLRTSMPGWCFGLVYISRSIRRL